jgi:DNA-binding phage protein
MPDRSHDDAMAEVLQNDPDDAQALLNSILEDGEQGELLITLRLRLPQRRELLRLRTDRRR